MGRREVHPAPPALRLPEGLAAGEPWAEGRHKRPSVAVVDRAGLDPAATFHTLHHAGITRMLKAGVPTQAVAGHHGTSARMLEADHAKFLPADRARYAALGALAPDPEHGTVKLMLVTAKKRRSSSALRAHAAASAPVTSAQIAKLWARATRYWVAVT
jgi:hypothetical protein